MDYSKLETMLEIQKEGKRIIFEIYYDNKKDFLNDAKEYLKLHNNLAKEIKILVDTITYGNPSNTFYVNDTNDDYSPNYIWHFQEILKLYSRDKIRGLRRAMDFKKKAKVFENQIEMFRNRYINADLYLDTLEEIKDAIEKENNIKKKTKYVEIENISNASLDKEIIHDIYLSGYSFIDYAFYNPIDISACYTYFGNINENSKNKEAIEIKHRESKTIPLILEIIERINNDDLDIIEYFEITKLNPTKLIFFAKQYGLRSYKLNNFISSYKDSSIINVEKVFNGKLIISNQEVPLSTKKEAVNYLNAINAPINSMSYNAMIKRLVNKKTSN
ncbi:MAG: hypothetical protein IJ572_00105 [Bacilli bacterium]|nr:hypothetical protein [Bacilli bacterium]